MRGMMSRCRKNHPGKITESEKCLEEPIMDIICVKDNRRKSQKFMRSPCASDFQIKQTTINSWNVYHSAVIIVNTQIAKLSTCRGRDAARGVRDPQNSQCHCVPTASLLKMLSHAAVSIAIINKNENFNFETVES